MHTHTYVHEHTCASITPSTRWSTDTETHNLCTNMHTHTHAHVYKRIHIHIHTHTCTYTYIYMSAHIHTYTYIHTRIQTVHMNARKARLKWRRGSDCAESPTWRQEALPFSLSAAIRRGVLFVAISLIARHEERQISAEQPQPTAVHHTITTARRPDHIRLSALVRSWSTQFTAHPSSELGRGPPKRGHFPAILAGFIEKNQCQKITGCWESAVYGSRPLITSTPGSSPPERTSLDNITSQPWSDATCPCTTSASAYFRFDTLFLFEKTRRSTSTFFSRKSPLRIGVPGFLLCCVNQVYTDL